ncbi:MAG: hypothetical protein ACTHLA_06215 [Asticcacaulis sp.]|uniref:hypothetical protein n=1 Tax=Asticcacaulis sp. TaxID=1872648 RepID=UPI003F7B3E9F
MSRFSSPRVLAAALVLACAATLAACADMNTTALSKPTPTTQNPAQQQHFPNP